MKRAQRDMVCIGRSGILGMTAASLPPRKSRSDRENGTAPGLPEAVLFESRRHGALIGLGIVTRFSFGGRDIADRFE